MGMGPKREQLGGLKPQVFSAVVPQLLSGRISESTQRWGILEDDQAASFCAQAQSLWLYHSNTRPNPTLKSMSIERVLSFKNYFNRKENASNEL